MCFLFVDFLFFSFVDLDRKGRAIFSFSPNIIQEASSAYGDMWLCSKGHLQKDGLGEKSSFPPKHRNISGASDLRAHRFNKPNRTWLGHKPNTAAHIVAREVSSQTDFL